MNITEFLLARIAEDEEASGLDHWDGRTCATSQGRHYDRSRILAECKAKRRIIEHVEPDPLALSPGDEYVLQLLAAPCDDHPDYDDAWRPR